MIGKVTQKLFMVKPPEGIEWYETNFFNFERFLNTIKVSKMVFVSRYKSNKKVFDADIKTVLYNIGATTEPNNLVFTSQDIKSWIRQYFRLPEPTKELLELARITKTDFMTELRSRGECSPRTRYVVTKMLNFFGVYKLSQEYIDLTEADRARFIKHSIKLHKSAKRKGFYDYPVSEKLSMALLITEVGEAIEALRENFEWYYYDNGKPCGYVSELVDIVIRIYDFWGYTDKKDFIIPKDSDLYSYSVYDGKPAEFVFDIGGLIYARDLERVIIYIEGYLDYHKYSLNKLIDEKYRYNKTRPVKHNKIF